MRAWVMGLLSLIVGAGVLSAQVEIPRDYAVVSPAVSFSDDQSVFNIEFRIRNAGAGATTDSTIVIINLLTQASLSESVLTPIPNGGSVNVTVPFNTRDFAAGQLPLEIRVGIDDKEPLDSTIAGNNIGRISVTIPDLPAQTSAGEVVDGIRFTDSGVTLFGQRYAFETVLGAGIALVVGVMILWLMTILLRALFRKPPAFQNWQPSYVNMPTLDPNSLEGRRQAWQAHAQNGIILAMPSPNNIHAIKVLKGTDGATLSNWKVTGVRASQYDNYGRVSRSQLVANGRWVNGLNALIRKRERMTPEKLEKAVTTLSRGLMRQFARKVNAKSAFLPVAFDLRFQGKHGEVRILFELYQSQNGMWYRLDEWEPAMSVNTQTIQESYTFTIHGMAPTETLRQYSARLGEDTAWLLNELLRVRVAPPAQPEPLTYNAPDTLSDMKPITI